MNILKKSNPKISIHLSNVNGVGATRLIQSLLPHILDDQTYCIDKVYLPEKGLLSSFKASNSSAQLINSKRYLPNVISRFFECTLYLKKFNNGSSFLVLGDIPLKISAKQVLFFQNDLLIPGTSSRAGKKAVIYMIARWIFVKNLNYVSAIIVQSDLMKNKLLDKYPLDHKVIHVIKQPPPEWIIKSGLKRVGRIAHLRSNLNLFYPAALYPHKNHKLLRLVKNFYDWPIDKITLTIDDEFNPQPEIPFLKCIGNADEETILKEYAISDGLIFLSLSESYGFPLLEAMWIGIPVICPDLPYAHSMCGSNAIYFDPYDANSLVDAVNELKKRLDMGWWPDWSNQIKTFPLSWGRVAKDIMRLLN